MGVVLSIIKWVVIVVAAFFVITFGVYFFNLDMKLTAAIEPLLLKWYDRVKRDRHL